MSTLKPDCLTEKEFSKMAKKEVVERKEYKNPVVFLRRSKAGNHLFVHDSREELIGGGTLIMNVSDVEKLIGGGTDWIKVSVLPAESAADKGEGEKSPSKILEVMVKRAEEEKKRAVGAYGEPQ